jgi:hypothetical protein
VSAPKKQFTKVFMNGLSMQHIRLIALSSISRTIEKNLGRIRRHLLLEGFAAQTMQYVTTLAEGSRFSPSQRQQFVSILHDETLAMHTSVEEGPVILRLLHRSGVPAAFSPTDLRRVMQAHIATAIPQIHGNWLQANTADPWVDQGSSSLAVLLSSVYQTRVDSNGAHHVTITGTGRVVESLDGLLFS